MALAMALARKWFWDDSRVLLRDAETVSGVV